MTERIAIFIDGGYLDAVLRDEFKGTRIDYEKFIAALCSSNTLLRSYYYTCEPWQSNPPSTDERKRFSAAQRFHNYLRRIPNFEVRLGRLAYRGQDIHNKPILEQKQVDILFAIDLLRLSYRSAISQAVLVTGDSDFIPAIKIAKDEGVQVLLAHGTKPHLSLLNEVDQGIHFDWKFIRSIKS
jgi:uncharacterized LabA/DUF88 family protein